MVHNEYRLRENPHHENLTFILPNSHQFTIAEYIFVAILAITQLPARIHHIMKQLQSISIRNERGYIHFLENKRYLVQKTYFALRCTRMIQQALLGRSCSYVFAGVHPLARLHDRRSERVFRTHPASRFFMTTIPCFFNNVEMEIVPDVMSRRNPSSIHVRITGLLKPLQANL